jgi:hypothetical protein
MGHIFNEIIAQNFPTLCNDMDTHVQEAFQTPNRHDQKKKNPHHIIIKMPKVENKERILKVAREKCQLTYKGKHIRITSDINPKNQESIEQYNSSSKRK